MANWKHPSYELIVWGPGASRGNMRLNALGYKRCSDCKEIKPLSEFYMRGTRGNGSKYATAKCVECCTIHYKTNVDHIREMRRKQRIGVAPGTYDLLVEMYGAVCAICGTDKPEGTAKDSGQFGIDHDKQTGTIRGLLCTQCNVGIGMLKHNPSLLMSAINYLSRRGHSPRELEAMLKKSKERLPGVP